MTRLGWIIATAVVALGVTLSARLHPAPKLVWNASASVPIGLYAVRPTDVLQIGELLVIAPPEPLAGFLADRSYLPKGVPLLKRVTALPGQTVCRSARVITVDGAAVGGALDRDHLGRPLPVWRGCRVVRAGEVFLMNPRSAASLDGRYFGPLPAASAIGRADPLWTEAEE